jgi:hypothetical protein
VTDQPPKSGLKYKLNLGNRNCDNEDRSAMLPHW